MAHALHDWSSSSRTGVSTVVGSIMVVSVLTRCALIDSMCDLKDAQMNMQYRLIWALIVHYFELGYDAMHATKNACCANSEDTVDHNIITR